jgi:hypothetical protein
MGGNNDDLSFSAITLSKQRNIFNRSYLLESKSILFFIFSDDNNFERYKIYQILKTGDRKIHASVKPNTAKAVSAIMSLTAVTFNF